MFSIWKLKLYTYKIKKHFISIKKIERLPCVRENSNYIWFSAHLIVPLRLRSRSASRRVMLATKGTQEDRQYLGNIQINLVFLSICTIFADDMEKIILGIDPGTNLMGYGLLKVVDGKAQMITMGVIDLRKFPDAYMKLGHIFERVTGIIDGYLPDEMAIEAPFFGKNVQSMLKLGRAQGTAIAAAIHHGVPIHEYAPMKIKMALTGNGSASKEQVAGMLQRLLKIPNEEMGKFMDATDALAAAYCHYLQMGRPESEVKYRGWKDFINKNQNKVSKRKTKDDDN